MINETKSIPAAHAEYFSKRFLRFVFAIFAALCVFARRISSQRRKEPQRSERARKQKSKVTIRKDGLRISIGVPRVLEPALEPDCVHHLIFPGVEGGLIEPEHRIAGNAFRQPNQLDHPVQHLDAPVGINGG